MTTIANTTTASGPAPSIKTRQQAMWASGDFAVIGTTLQIVGENLCEAIDLRAGERVLDVAAGNGNATLDTDGQASFEADLIALLRRADRGGAGGLVVPGEYLETVIIR